MKRPKNLKILAIVGLSGAGKSTATEYLVQKGYPKVHFGSVIMNALDDAGIEPTLENEKIMRDKLRAEKGDDVVVKRIVQQIDDLADSGQHRIIADGMGSWTAYKTLKHEFPGELVVVAVTTPRHIRHRRLADRPKRPLTSAETDQRDYDEIETLGKGGPIAIADYYLPNGGSREQLQTQVDRLLHDIEF
jgi:dephospho-CoA kinase